jgi:hypothetical protein
MMKTIGGALAFVLACTAAPASAEFELDQTIIENFDGDDVGKVLTQIDAIWSRKTDDDGSPYYEIHFSNAYVGYAELAACGDEAAYKQCMGLSVYASFEKVEDVPIATLVERTNRFNANHSVSKGTIDEEGSGTVSLYVMTDYGITRSNLYIQLKVFEGMIEKFDEALFTE